MIDATPLTIEDVVQHCRALTQAIIESESHVIKESLTFILSEKIEWLSLKLDEDFIPEMNHPHYFDFFKSYDDKYGQSGRI